MLGDLISGARQLRVKTMSKNMKQQLADFITSDEVLRCPRDKIKKIYNNFTNEEKNQVDDIFIHLCGYSLETLLKDEEEDNG